MKLEDIQIAGCAIVQDRIHEIVPNVKQVYPYVDYLVLINGGDTDGWVNAVKEVDIDNKIYIIDFPWCDNFPLSRNQYLINAGKFRDLDKTLWICRFDSDEFISIGFLEKMRILILYAEQERYNMVGIRCRGITLDKQGNIVHETLDDFWKGLVYKWYPNLQYVAGGQGFVHEGYNIQMNMFKTPSKEERGKEKELVYLHVKEQGVVWERAQRNFFIRGGGPNLGTEQKLWEPFRKLLVEIGLNPETYHDYINYLKKGNVDEKLKNWFIRYMYEGEKNKPKEWLYYVSNKNLLSSGTDLPDVTMSRTEYEKGYGYDGASEVKEGYKVYFRWYHPEEEPEELRNLSIP